MYSIIFQSICSLYHFFIPNSSENVILNLAFMMNHPVSCIWYALRCYEITFFIRKPQFFFKENTKERVFPEKITMRTDNFLMSSHYDTMRENWRAGQPWNYLTAVSWAGRTNCGRLLSLWTPHALRSIVRCIEEQEDEDEYEAQPNEGKLFC
jgi:hypothetical protein